MPRLSVLTSALVGIVAASTLAVGSLRADEPATRQQNQAARPAAGEQDPLAEYFAAKLLLANKAEIALSKIAEQRSQNAEVKQLAAMLIRDHEKLDQQIAQLAPQAAAKFAARTGRRTTETPEQIRTSEQTRTGAREQAAGENSAHGVLTRLCQIEHKACDIHTEHCKAMLERYQGQDFDMAYLGMQIGAHTWLLSELEAIGNVGNSEFQALVTEARQSVEQHLTKAKQLAQKLEDDRGRASS